MKNIIGSIYGDIHIRFHPCTVCELEDEEADTVLCAAEDIQDYPYDGNFAPVVNDVSDSVLRSAV